MISTVLIELRGFATAAFVVVALLCAGVGWALRSRGAHGRRALRILAVLALLPALALTFVPNGDPPSPVFCAVDFAVPLPPSSIEAAEIALLLPAALLLAVQARRPALVLVLGVLVVVGIELTQAELPDLGRSCDTNDVWLNSLGVGLGVGLAALVRVLPARSRPLSPS